jgi:hypothetical protein
LVVEELGRPGERHGFRHRFVGGVDQQLEVLFDFLGRRRHGRPHEQGDGNHDAGTATLHESFPFKADEVRNDFHTSPKRKRGKKPLPSLALRAGK